MDVPVELCARAEGRVDSGEEESGEVGGEDDGGEGVEHAHEDGFVDVEGEGH